VAFLLVRLLGPSLPLAVSLGTACGRRGTEEVVEAGASASGAEVAALAAVGGAGLVEVGSRGRINALGACRRRALASDRMAFRG
jgi:hypothetical protein